MKSDLQKISSLERKLNIEVPASVVSAAFDNAFKRVQRQAEIKGFRKGKAPIAMIKSMYRERVVSDVIQNLIQENYGKALDEHDLSPLGAPTIDIESGIDEASDLKFTAQFEIRPEIQNLKYEGLEVLREKIIVSNEMIDTYIKNMLQRSAKLESITDKRPLQKDDFAMIDFQGFDGDVALSDVSGKDLPVKIGAGQFLPGFEDQLIGLDVGSEKSFDQTIPADYHHKPIAGKTIKFKVSIKDIRQEITPELNDEFAKKMGKDSVDDLKKSIREEIEEDEKARVEEEFKKRIFTVLADNNPVDIPPTLKAEQRKKLVDDFRHRMLSQGMSEKDYEQYQKDWANDFDKTANFMVHSYFIVDKLAKDNGLKANAKDIEEKIESHAKATGIDMNRMQAYYNSHDARSRLSYQITEERVVDFLKSKLKIKEVEKSQIKE